MNRHWQSIKSVVIKHCNIALLLLFCTTLLPSCTESGQERPTEGDDVLFEKLDPESSGITFKNPIKQNSAFNLFKWKYIYNGAGVALGDINNDGLSDIYFVANSGPNKLYLNKGNMEFEDMTAAMGLTAMSGYQTGVSMVDLNGDDKLDIFICRDADQNPNFRNNLIYINNGDSTFTQSNSEMGMLDQSYTTQALFIDYDRDNDLDVFLINHPADFDNSIKLKVKRRPDGTTYRDTTPTSEFSGHRLFEYREGKYVDVTQEMGLAYESFGLGGVILDVNEDGWQDIFVANDFLEPDMLFINQRGKGFVESASSYFKHFTQNSMGVDYQDINNDGRGDLVVLDMLAESNYRQKSFATSMTLNQYETWERGGYGRQIMRNMLHLNLGTSFAEVGMLAGIEKSDWSWSPIMADFDLDGDNDLFVSNGIYKDMSDKDFIVYLSDSMSLARRKGIEALTAENYDEWIDLIPSTPLPNKFYLNEGNLQLRDIPPSQSGLSDSTFTQGAAIGDLDGDGDPDLIINNTEGAAIVYKNNANKPSLKITLSGPGHNKRGYNSKVTLYSSGRSQTKWLHANAGYLSSNEPSLIFGGIDKNPPDSIVVLWPNGKKQSFLQIESPGTVELEYDEKKVINDITRVPSSKLLTEQDILRPTFTHKDGSYDVFKSDPLLLKSTARMGPAVVVGDVTGDGQDDFFAGGGPDQPGALYISGTRGFSKISTTIFDEDAKYEDVAATFFDLDGDGDLDLYVASGGSGQLDLKDYYDRVYINDGSGNFTDRLLIPLAISGKSVLAFDYDNDGDDDLFLGNYLDPANPYKTPDSYLIENDNGTLLPRSLGAIGHVTDVISRDLNEDKLPDLLIVGHWMSPQVLLQNKNGDFTNRTNGYLPGEPHQGFWNCIVETSAGYLLGNEGINVPFEVNKDAPITTYISDFDSNGMQEGIVTHYIDGIEYPYARRETLTQQLPYLKKKFLNYNSYAKAKFTDIFDPSALQQASVRKVNELRSAVLSISDSTLNLQFLPRLAQVTPIFAATDLGDAILLAGNYHHNEVEIGPYDAGYGILMDDKQNILLLKESLLAGEIRSIKHIQWNGQKLMLVAQNNGELKLVTYK